MKNINKTTMELIKAACVMLLALTSVTCSNASGDESRKREQKVVVSEDKNTITFPENYEGLKRIKSVEINSSTVCTSVIAPSRVVATISHEPGKKEKTVLFDSPEMTSLYSQYRQSRINVEFTGKNLARIKDMFETNAVTGRELTQAESDAANARTTLAEMEGRIKVTGFDAKEIDNTPPGMLWLISDVAESQIREVTKGEDVDIVFNSYPDKKFTGRAVSVGDAVDPVTRTLKVRVAMKTPKLNILPGMFARIDYGDPQSGVILVPASAVFTVEGKNYVFIQISDTVFIKREVMLSDQVDSNIIVLKGISKNERVVVDGTILLKGLCYQY